MGGAAAWCATCSDFASAQGEPRPSDYGSERRSILMCRESTEDAPRNLALDDTATWRRFERQLSSHAQITLAVHYSFDARWDALPQALRTPVTSEDNGRGIALGFQRPVRIGTYVDCGDGCPRHVQMVAAAIDHAAKKFDRLGFLPPLMQGGRLDVKLVHCDGVRGGTHFNGNIIEIERSLTGAQAALTAAHELFHRIQFAYLQGIAVSPLFRPMLMEGGARFAEDVVFDLADRYAEDRRVWFTAQNVSLMTWPSPATSRPKSLSYETSLFWKFLAEQGGAPRGADGSAGDGAETQRIVLDAMRSAPSLRDDLPSLMARSWSRMDGIGHFDRIWRSPRAGGSIVCDDTVWGNFAVALVLNGVGTPDSRFSFGETRFWVRERHERMAIPSSQTVAFAALPSETTPHSADDTGLFRWRDDEPARVRQRQNPPTGSVRPVCMLQPYAVRAYRVTLPEGGDDALLRVTFSPEAGLDDALVQVLMIGQGGGLSDIVRLDATEALTHLVPTIGLEEIVVLVTSRRTAGDFQLRLAKADPAPLPFITSWNAAVGKHLTLDPRRFAWSWTSPDLEIFRNSQDLSFKCVVRNRGTLKLDEVTVHLEAASLARLADDAADPWQAIADPVEVRDVWPVGLCAIERERETDHARRCDIDRHSAVHAEFRRLDLAAGGIAALTDIAVRARLARNGEAVGPGGTALTCIGGSAPSTKEDWRLRSGA